MAERPWWRRAGDALFGRDVPGLSFPRDVDNPPPTDLQGLDLDAHGPYPREWDDAARELWDSEPGTVRDLYTRDEWRDAQTAFHYGWIATGMSKEEHDEWRDRFYQISGVAPQSFDWAAAREYWADTSGAIA